MEDFTEHQVLNELMVRRREELAELTRRGINAYPYFFERTAFSADIIAEFREDLSMGIRQILFFGSKTGLKPISRLTLPMSGLLMPALTVVWQLMK